MEPLKVSVIVPNYNNGKYLKKCFDSIYVQKYQNIEVIFVDDGSTDDSINIANKYKKEHNLDIKIYQQYNQNAAIARNFGINKSNGDVLYFLDSDDEIYDCNVFINAKEYFNDNDLIIGNYKKINENSENIGDYIVKKDLTINEGGRYKYSLLSPVPSNKFYKRNLIDEYNIYFDNVRIGQDLNFYLKYLSVCNNIKIIDNYIYKYRILDSSMTRSKNYNLFDITNTFANIKKFYSLNNNLDNYNKYIALTELRHYKWQMEKLVKYSNYKTKNLIYNYFSYFISNIDFSEIVDRKILEIELLEYRIKKIFKWFYFSKFYIKVRKFLKGKIKNESN